MVFCGWLLRKGLTTRDGALLGPANADASHPRARRARLVRAVDLALAAHAGPRRLLPAHPPAGTAALAANRQGGAALPAAFHGEGRGAHVHLPGRVRPPLLPRPGLLDGASRHLAGSVQNGEELGARPALQQRRLQAA